MTLKLIVDWPTDIDVQVNYPNEFPDGGTEGAERGRGRAMGAPELEGTGFVFHTNGNAVANSRTLSYKKLSLLLATATAHVCSRRCLV